MKRQVAIIAALTLAAQFSAFIKLWFTARVFGLGADLDGYNLALVLPVLISGSLSGIVQTGLFPVRARLAARSNSAEVAAFERAVLLAVVALGVLLSLGLALSFDLVSHWVIGNAPAQVQTAFREAFAPLAALLALNLLGDSAGYLLAMRNRFPIAAAAPIANGLIGAAILAASPEGGVMVLVVSTLVGLVVQVAICAVSLPRAGLKLFGPLPGLSAFAPKATDMVKLGILAFPGVLLANLVLNLPQIWITGFGEGAVSAFGYALRLHLAIVQLVIMASATVLLARLSELVSLNQTHELDRVMRTALLASLGVGFAGLLAVWLVGELVLGIVLGGRFTPEDAHRVTHHWLILTAGLPFAIIGAVYSKLWQARSKPLLLVLGPAANLAGMWGSFTLASVYLGEYSGAAAMSVGAALSAIMAVVIERLLRRSESAHDGAIA